MSKFMLVASNANGRIVDGRFTDVDSWDEWGKVWLPKMLATNKRRIKRYPEYHKNDKMALFQVYDLQQIDKDGRARCVYQRTVSSFTPRMEGLI